MNVTINIYSAELVKDTSKPNRCKGTNVFTSNDASCSPINRAPISPTQPHTGQSNTNNKVLPESYLQIVN